MTRRLRALAPCAALLLALGTTQPAAAGDKKAAAQALFDQGRELIRVGRFAEACPKLAESLRLDAGIGTMLFLADCYEHTGQTASAWALFKDAAAFATQLEDTRAAVARRRASELEPRLTHVTIAVPREAMLPGLEIRRGGIPITAAQIGIPIPVDPGIHVLTAAAPEHRPWSTNLEIPARTGTIAVNIPVLSKGDAGAPPSPVSVATDAPAPASHGSALRPVALVVAGGGVLALGLGAFLGLRAKSTYDASNEGHCVDDRCDAVGIEKRSSAFDLATGSTIAFGVGAAALAAGGILWFVAPRRGTTVVPEGGGGRAGLVVSHTF